MEGGAASGAASGGGSSRNFSIAGWQGYNSRFNGGYANTGENKNDRAVYSHHHSEGVGAGHDWCRLWYNEGYWRIGHVSWVHGDHNRCVAAIASEAEHPSLITGTWLEHPGQACNEDHGYPNEFQNAQGNPHVIGGAPPTHEPKEDFQVEHHEGHISAYDLAGCFIGGCYLPLMTTTYMILPEDDDHYRACGCSNCGPLPIPWGFPYERRPGTNTFKRSENPDEDMGEFLCSGCMMHKIWWACKIIPCSYCYTTDSLPAPPPSHGVNAMTPPGQKLGAPVTVSLSYNGCEQTTV